MFRFGLVLFFAALSSAQDNPFNKPPADVDAALRARITEFYDYHVKGQFRKADEMVAEDTKDYYFESRKPQYISFEISRIDYSDNFTRAKAVIMCEMYIMMPGFNDKPMKMPTPSSWKIENGKWFWYVDMKSLRNTPFGPMSPGPPAKQGQGGPPPMANINLNPDFLFNQVKVNKSNVEMWPGDADEVIVVNTAPGNMGISVSAAPEGIDATLDKTNLKTQETAVLKIKAAKDAKPGAVTVQVEQTGQLIPIQVKFKLEPTMANSNSNGFLINQVKVNKPNVEMRAGDSAEVIVVNAAPGIMGISVAGAPQGIDATLDKTNLKSQETAVLKIKAGKDAKPGAVTVQVEQTGQLIPIQVKLK